MQSVRQSELFTANDWTNVYAAFSQINFNASDPVSINAALRQYLQNTYPEDYNDWIASSEFMAVVELLSWLAGTLAYKTDIAARENFLETAEARESVIRLARFLSYNATRNQCARGLLKIVSMQTDETITDAFGSNLQNLPIVWNDPNNSEWFDQMALILNSAFFQTNPFGVPISSAASGSINTQVYGLNSVFGNCNLTFASTINGVSMPFEVINTKFDSLYGFTEVAPDLNSHMNMVYQSDGQGNGSSNTGFFVGFKQGSLKSSNFAINTPVENQLIDIPVDGINQSDVWVQTVSDSGGVMINWTKTPTVWTGNITYNPLIPASTNNIFAAITKDNDQVMIRFSDGRFGAAPVGNMRVWYRTSNGMSYTVRPSDIQNIQIVLPYTNLKGASYNLTLTLSLASSVSNSAPAETIEQIKVRAPQVYATQNRMVSGQDYNIFPMQSNLATKIKALTRIYSGQSRHIDLNDPTGNYTPTTIFADDGIFYKERAMAYKEVFMSGAMTSQSLLSDYIVPALSSPNTLTAMQDYFIIEMLLGSITVPNSMTWIQSSATATGSTGFVTGSFDQLISGSMIKVSSPSGVPQWAGVVGVYGDPSISPRSGNAAPVVLTHAIPSGSQILGWLPPYAANPTTTFQTQVLYKIQQNLSFTLWYDYTASTGNQWTIGSYTALSDNNIATLNSGVLVMSAKIVGSVWCISTISLRYIFESMNAVKFFFNGTKTVNVGNGQTAQDLIRILSVNPNLNSGGPSLRLNYDLTTTNMITYPNGYSDPSRIVVTPYDTNEDGYADRPDLFYAVSSMNPYNHYLFWATNTTGGFVPISTMVVYELEADRIAASPAVGSVAFQITSTTYPNTFWTMTSGGWVANFTNYRFANGRGPNVASQWYASGGGLVPLQIGPNGAPILFQWNHYSPSDNRIDPARSNIIDLFVLMSSYDTEVRKWIAAGATGDIPVSPNETDLLTAFSTYENYKMFSDNIVWRPVTYRYLFGAGADPALGAQFKVVVMPSATMSQGEISARIIKLINSYFDSSYWDFGETFYFTELAAYVHMNLAAQISSFVIVPTARGATFGADFEVHCRADQLLISTAQVSDIIIIEENTAANLRIG